MEIVSKIKIFNTGRQYSAEGQRIAYAKVKLENHPGNLWGFYDLDRNVYGLFFNTYQDSPTNDMVLAAYDNYNFSYAYPGINSLFLKAIADEVRSRDSEN